MAEMLIPVANPLARYQRRRDEFRAAIDRVLEGGRYILGDEVASFENEFAKYVGSGHCVGVANGTEALAIALKAAGVEPGDEVITVSHSAVATVAAVEMIGAEVVLCDIETVSRCIDPWNIERCLSEKTKAIVPVHIYGHPANMAAIMGCAEKFGLRVVEDCAQAHGARIDGRLVGTFGDAAAFSFYPTKNLGAFGDAGAIVTNNPDIASACGALREYGWTERYVSHHAGWNSRLDELQAAILRVGLKDLDQDNRRRAEIAQRYNEVVMEGIVKPLVKPGYDHAYHLYVVEVESGREAFREYLAKHGIMTALHYPLPVHLQPAYKGRLKGHEELPVTEAFSRKHVTLPMFPELSDDQVDMICKALSGWNR